MPSSQLDAGHGSQRPVQDEGVADARNRTVALPAAALTALRGHMKEYVGADGEALVFSGERGAVLRPDNFRRAVSWSQARVKAGLPPNFTFHDLRHTGNNLAAASGASARELMHRMGHASMRAALIYQHATSERDSEIAAEMDRRIAGRASGAPRKTAATRKAAESKKGRGGQADEAGGRRVPKG